jgi:hypothetical protein
MSHLATIKGKAALVADGKEIEDVEYIISIFQDYRGIKKASGKIYGSILTLDRGFHSQVTHLSRTNGDTIEIIVTKLIPAEGCAEIVASGPAMDF